jgi:hypothetical protein
VITRVRFAPHWRSEAAGEANIGTNYNYQQWSGTVGLGYQWKRIGKLGHLVNIDPDNESRLVFAGGYQYLWTETEGSATTENRLGLQVTPRAPPWARWLLADRNRFEFRWVNGKYSSRYRNQFEVQRDLLIDGFRFTPYASVEVFYDLEKGIFDQEWYAVGIQWPVRRILNLQAYYLLQHSTSAPETVNVLGLTATLYFRNGLGLGL